MIPGSNHVVACSRCSALAQYRTLATESLFFTRLWTDGFVSGPLLNPLRTFFVCRNCGLMQWLCSAKKVRIYEEWDIPSEQSDDEPWYRAPLMQDPGEEHYYRMLRDDAPMPKQVEQLVRTNAWRRRNDVHRVCGVRSTEADAAEGLWTDLRLEAEHVANVERLCELFSDDGVFEQILHAELLRQDAQFGAALDVLARTQTQRHTALARAVRERCERRDSLLGQVGKRG